MLSALASRERGAVAALVAVALSTLLLGIAAIAIDIGFGFNERRQDQTSADVSVMAGVIDAVKGPAVMRDEALTYARQNLDTIYTDAQWQALWEGCTDPNKNDGGFNFQPVPAPSGWSAATLDCISIDPTGYFRVRIPDQQISTHFGRLLGFDTLTTHAAAIGKIASRGTGGVLPFGLAIDVAEGSHVCLSSGPTGLAQDPCDGSDSGNFGTLKGRLFGNPDIPTDENCTASPLGDVLAVNIAAGMDHWVTVDTDGDPGNEVRDQCFNLGVDTLNTDTGFPNQGAAEGLATGPVDNGLTPRLQQGPNSKRNVVGYQLDDVGLWSYIDPALTSTDVPASCVKSSFDPTDPANTPFDWDGDGTLDQPNSWQHVAACLDDYLDGSYSIPLFLETLRESPRFSYVPQFWEDDLGNGNSWLHIRRFKAVWLQGTYWKKGKDWVVHHPGENCACGGNGYAMKQLSGLVIPDEMLPSDLRGDPPPTGGLNPYQPELYQ